MPLKKATWKSKKAVQKAISSNIKELVADNKKTGKEKGANWKERPMKQIIAIAYAQAKPRKKLLKSKK